MPVVRVRGGRRRGRVLVAALTIGLRDRGLPRGRGYRPGMPGKEADQYGNRQDHHDPECRRVAAAVVVYDNRSSIAHAQKFSLRFPGLITNQALHPAERRGRTVPVGIGHGAETTPATVMINVAVPPTAKASAVPPRSHNHPASSEPIGPLARKT